MIRGGHIDVAILGVGVSSLFLVALAYVYL